MQDHQLFRFQSGHCIGTPLIVAEFDLKNAGGKLFNNCSHLAACQTRVGQILGQGYHIQKLYHRVCRFFHTST